MLRRAVAVPPAPEAARKLTRLMPGTAAEVMAALLTVPSASVALMSALPLMPKASDRLAGQVVTIGGCCGTPQAFSGLVLLRGSGAPALKSLPLLAVSAQPPLARNAAVVLLRPGPTLPSK